MKISIFTLFIASNIFILLCSLSIFGQPSATPSVCINNLGSLPNDLTIRSIKIQGRSGNKSIEKKLQTKLIGTKFIPQTVSITIPNTINYISNQITTLTLNDEANISFEKQIGIIGGATPAFGGAEFLQIKQCIKIDKIAKMVDLSFDILFLRADLSNVARNILPIPRSLKPSFYNKMSPVLRTLNPQFGFNYDLTMGPEGSLDISTNLLEISKLWKGEKISNSNYRLELKFSGSKSFSNQFYQSKTNLAFSKLRPGKVVEKLKFNVGFTADNTPLGENNFTSNGLETAGQIKFRPRVKMLNTIYFDGNYSYNNNSVFSQSGTKILGNKENKLKARTLIDGILWNGFSRIGIWFETAKINNSSGNYQRLAGIVAYQKEFGKGTQTIGLEALFGGGKVWGTVPQYARFWGGNNSSNFLYDSPDSRTMSDFPSGPLLRSYGKSQVNSISSNNILNGGKSYWHTNFNLSIPIKPWSKPLIPNENIQYSNGVFKLNTILENFTINSAIGGIGDSLLDKIIEDLTAKNPNLTEAEIEQLAVQEATKQANKIVDKEIKPTIQFIARHANLFAVKPLIMFDAAKLSESNQVFRNYRFGVGGGLQFVVVTARAEFGYLRSLPRKTGETKGNFVFRITFQNLF